MRCLHASLVIVCLIVLSFGSLQSQPPSAVKETQGIPWVGEPGITRTVAEIAAEAASHPAPQGVGVRDAGREFPNFRFPKNDPSAPSVPRWPFRDEKQSRDVLSTSFAPQTIGTTFLGANISEAGFVPPDCVGDVGPTQVVMVVNGRIKVFDKNGVVGGLNVSTDNFFASVGGVTNGTSDPHVRYDRLSGRWFVVMISVGNLPNDILLAVSSGPTITSASSFTFFKFQFDAVGTTPNSDTGQFADYPTLGVDANALYIGANIFNGAGTAFIGTTGFVVRKSTLLTGTLIVTAFRQLCVGSGAGPYAPQGVDNDDPLATEGYFIGVDDSLFSRLAIRRITTPGGTPSISGNIFVTVPATDFPILQVVKGSAANRRLDGLDDRLFAAHLRKDKNTGVMSLWTAHNIEVNASGVASVGGGRNGSRWYELQNMTTTPTLHQSGTLFDPAVSNPRGYWIPSVAMSGQGHMALGSSYASVNDFAGIAVAGRYSGDALGTIQSPTFAQVSSTAYNAQSQDGQRWGDFSQTVVDPTDDMTLWTFQEYCDATNSWALRVVQLKAPLPATPSGASPPSVTQNTTNVNVTITGTSSNGTGFFDPGVGFPNHISATVNGGGVTVNSVTYTDPTHITLNLNVSAGATPFARTITVTNPDGQSATSATGILTILNGTCPTITLAPTTLPSGSAGTVYSQSITASGGVAPYAYSIVSGSLPGGMTLSSLGVLSGTPLFGGTSNFTVQALDSIFCVGTRSYTLFIAGCPQLSMLPASLPLGKVGISYLETVQASGGTAPYVYTISAGLLPTGLSLLTSGTITGTPTAAGIFNFTVQALDSNSCVVTRAYAVTIVNCQAITIFPAVLPSGTVGVAYNQTLTASGGTGPYTYAVTSGTLPAGLSLSSGGILSGTPTTNLMYNFTITATDANTCANDAAYTVQIWLAGVSPASLTALGTAYTQDFNTLATSGISSTLPLGWQLSEAGTLANSTYTAGTGSSNTGDTYSFGASGNSERAFGGLHSGSLLPTIGASFINNTGATVTELAIAYRGEQWRLGATGRVDSIGFQMSLNAVSLTTGTWTSYTALRFTAPVTGPTVGALDGNSSTNRTAISSTISGFSIPNGASFMIRWMDADATGADDGLAVDDFSMTPGPVPTNPTAIGNAAPNPVVAGNATLLTVTVTPGTNPTSTGLAVTGNLSLIGGSAAQTFSDAGTNGDVTPGDNIFSYQATVSAGTSSGPKSLPVSVIDAQSRTASASIALTVNPAPTNPTASGSASPNPVIVGATTLLTVTVTPGANPTSTGLSVTGNLSTINGSSAQAFFDNGTNGDVTAGDNVFSYLATVPGGTTTGGKSLPIQVTDAQSRSGATSISLSVNPAPTNPTTNVNASPNPVIVGAGALLTVAVTPGANPTSTGLTVTGNLTPIGGGAAQAFSDNGTNGDVTAGDNIFSYLATVTIGTLPGSKLLPVSVTDAQSRSALDTIPLTVNPAPTNPTGTGTASPSPVNAGSATLLMVTVTPGANPPSTGIGVTGNLTSIGGLGAQQFYDNATHGDSVSGDNVFSYDATVGIATVGGVKSLPMSITDAQSRSGSAAIALTVISSATNPSASAAATPSTVIAGNATLLTVTVTPGANPTSTAITVTGDLSTIGGSGTQGFFDNGTNGDVSAGDDIFSYQAAVPLLTAPGVKSLPVSVADGEGRGTATAIALTVDPAPTPPTAVGTATPSTVVAGNATLLAVTVTPGDHPVSTGIGVTANLASIGGGGAQQLYDDATHGDVTAGDRVFSYQATVALATSPGSKSLAVSVTDAQARSASSSIALIVTAPCPTITVTPSSVPNGMTSVAYFQTYVASGGAPAYTFTVISGQLPIGLTLSSSGVLSGTPTQAETASYTVRATDLNGCTGTVAGTIIVAQNPGVSQGVPVGARWNIVSNPMTVFNDSVYALFPTRVSNAFGYNGAGYVIASRLLHGFGYWMKFGASQTVNIVGLARTRDTINVTPGWNLIGSISSSIPVSALSTINTTIRSRVFGYEVGYAQADSLRPGWGYWIKVDSAGKCILAAGSVGMPTAPRHASPVDPAALNAFTVEDAGGFSATLSFGRGTLPEAERDLFELPPVPPFGNADVRFATQASVEVFSFDAQAASEARILLTSLAYPLTIRWQMRGEAREKYSLWTGAGSIPLETAGSATIAADAGTDWILHAQDRSRIPSRYALHQNYPNPFNPATTIRFDLPVRSVVSLGVFNTLGEQVASLRSNELCEGGEQSATLNAQSLPSGVYYYRLTAVSQAPGTAGQMFTDVKKLLFVK